MDTEKSHEIMAVDVDDLPDADVSLETVRSGLDSDRDSVRIHAAKVAADLSEAEPERVAEIAPALVDGLDDDVRVVVFQSTIALSNVAEVDPERLEPAVAPLVALLGHEFPEIRSLASRGLAAVVLERPEYFEDHVDELVAAAAVEPEDVLDVANQPEDDQIPPTVENPTANVNKDKRMQQMLARETAATLFVEVADHDPTLLEPHVDDLVVLLDDPNLGVATAAAQALGSIAEENPAAVAEAVDPLRELLDEDDETLVATAVRALGFAGDPAAVPDLRDLAADEDRDGDLRDLAAETADFL